MDCDRAVESKCHMLMRVGCSGYGGKNAAKRAICGLASQLWMPDWAGRHGRPLLSEWVNGWVNGEWEGADQFPCCLGRGAGRGFSDPAAHPWKRCGWLDQGQTPSTGTNHLPCCHLLLNDDDLEALPAPPLPGTRLCMIKASSTLRIFAEGAI
eukprot:223414-Pelagomonas_calceolata.AAC.9